MGKLWTGILVVASLVLPATARAQSLFVFPDSFRLAEDNGRPLVRIIERRDETEVALSFITSWTESITALKRQYGDAYYDLDIVKVGVMPVHLDFASEFFTRANPALIDAGIDYVHGEVRVRLRYNRDYLPAELREAVLFPVSLGTVDVKVTCLGSIVFDRCGTAIKRVPLINQFARNGNDAVLLRAAHYAYLHTYASNLVVTRYRYLSVEFSAHVRATYWHGGDCDRADRTWHQDACRITRTYSPTLSIRDAMLALAADIYPEAIASNIDYFVLSADQLKVHRLNLAMDFERIRTELNARFTIHAGDDVLEAGIPLVPDITISSDFVFTIAPDSMFWNDQLVVLLTGEHMRGESELELAYLGQRHWVPVAYDIHLGFAYDPMNRTVRVDHIHIEDLEFLRKHGAGYELAVRNRRLIESAINTYIQAEPQKEELAAAILRFLHQLQDAGIGFTPLME